MSGAVEERHEDFVGSLTTEQRLRLTKRTNGHALARLAIHFGLILLLLTLVAVEVPYRFILLLPLGILIVFLFTLMHETIHRTAFKSRYLNDGVAALCGWLIFLPPQWFRYFHFEHHRHTQDPGRDPELTTSKPQSLRQYLWHLTGLPVAYSQIKTLLANARDCCSDPFVPEKGAGRVTTESRVMLLSYLLLVLITLWLGLFVDLLLCWWLPLLIGQPFLRLYLMAEHGHCPFVSNMFANTRTVYTTPLIRALAWNMPFHAEHHTYPSVPFHQLPELHRLVKVKLRVTSNGYSEFHRDTIEQYKTGELM